MQLVKGHDDLRGDAVMQQVFSLVNVLLRRDPSTRQRGLCMRTYRVVPIAPTAGVLQWVDDTSPLTECTSEGVQTSSAPCRLASPHRTCCCRAASTCGIARGRSHMAVLTAVAHTVPR